MYSFVKGHVNSLFANGPNNQRILSATAFESLLSTEKQRSDYIGCPFSLISLPVKELGFSPERVRIINKYLKQAVRSMDEVGWISKDSVGVFLFNTPSTGAHACKARLKSNHEFSALLAKAEIHCYLDNGTPISIDRTVTSRRPHFIQ